MRTWIAPHRLEESPHGPARVLAVLALVWITSPSISGGTDAVVWQGRFEMGDATVLLQIEISEPGEASAWLTGFDGVRRPTAIEAFEADFDEVAFGLPEIGRGYSFSGRLVSPTRIEGTLQRLPPQVPATDLYTAPIELEATGVRLGTPRALTDRAGYDNQPRFLPSGRSLLYTSMRDDQTDIFHYDFESGTIHQLTDTPESEYSPTPLPGGGGFSTVRVEQDGTQRLWAFDLDGTNPRLLLPEIEPVGYHAWIDETTVALFVLGEPPTLHLAHLETGESERIADDPGRALQPLESGRGVLFVDKTAQDSWWLAEVGPGRSVERWPIETLPEREDFLWIGATRQALMARGSKLFAAVRPGEGGAGVVPEGSVPAQWHEIADLASLGIGDVSRLALAPDGSKLVFVADRPDLSPFPERLPLTLLAVGLDD